MGIVGGIIQAKGRANRGHVKAFRSIGDLPVEERTRLIRDQPAAILGQHTFTGSSIESLGFQVSVVVMVSAAAYGLSLVVEHFYPALSVPVFILGLYLGAYSACGYGRGKVYLC